MCWQESVFGSIIKHVLLHLGKSLNKMKMSILKGSKTIMMVLCIKKKMSARLAKLLNPLGLNIAQCVKCVYLNLTIIASGIH